MYRMICILVLVAALASSCQNRSSRINNKTEGGNMDIKVTSTAFQDQETIPKKYTCDGQKISPPLTWSGIPEDTKSIALIMDDPDAPRGTFVHWVLFNLPADTTEFPENVPNDRTLKNGAKQGTNSGGGIGYISPCPPSGTHRYYFKVYALDRELDLQPGIKEPELVKAMEGHILAKGQLMGKYTR